MLDSTDLRSLLSHIFESHQREQDPVRTLLWAKMAVMEVGGWTEDCVDKIITERASDLGLTSCKPLQERVKRTHGFGYSDHFRPLIVELVGNVGADRVEQRLLAERERLKMALAELKQARDTRAHTHIRARSQIDAPSKAIDLLNKIERELNAFSRELAQIELKP